MNILVAVKHAVEAEQPVYVHNGGVDFAELEHGMNVWDEHALEAALCLKGDHGGQVTAVTVGGEASLASLQRAFAMGVDRGIHLDGGDGADPFSIACGLCRVVASGAYDLVLLGDQSMDTGCGQVGPLLGALLGWPSATRVVSLAWDGRGDAVVTQEMDRGRDVRRMALPAVLAVGETLNEPRSPSLRGILQSKGKMGKVVRDSSPAVGPRSRVEAIFDPPVRPPGRVLEGEAEAVAEEMASILCARANVLQTTTKGCGGLGEDSYGD